MEEKRRFRASRQGINAERPEVDEDGLLLTKQEAHDVDENRSPTPQVLHETVRLEGEAELARTAPALLWSALAAGLSMGFSMLAPALMMARFGDTPAGWLLAGLGYSVGFLIVILARQQLFTENTLTAVLPLMTHPRLETLLRLLRLWGLVLAGNLVGAALFAWGVRQLDLMDATTHEALIKIGHHLMDLTSWQMFSRAVVAGWLIATLVWLLPGADTSRVTMIIVITSLIGLGGLAHIIAGAAEVLYLVFSGGATMMEFVLHFALPTLAGNVVGGSLIFALISHAQVRGDQPE
ncbi:formate/nitrite transporter family protein [Lysobacter korlensis]|uniref:Formate/nitrite transporter family protein n=1 Tax=Lysobacter korlensis TaxID=553636 RepID=A0ABV6RRS0_9GAMM